MSNITETNATEFVKKWAELKGIKVQDKQREGVGYDYEFIYPDGRIEKIEVKGSKEHRIPDMSVKEFDNNKRLVADFLFVVANVLENGKEVLYIIPKEDIKPESLLLKQTYRIERFQGKKNMKKYRVK